MVHKRTFKRGSEMSKIFKVVEDLEGEGIINKFQEETLKQRIEDKLEYDT